MVVSLDVRGLGVGRALSQETFAIALGAGLDKLSVQMTVDQQAAIALFEGLDRRPRRCFVTTCGMSMAKRMTSWCSATTSLRSALKWRLTACRAPFSTDRGTAGISVYHDFVISRCNIDIALQH